MRRSVQYLNFLNILADKNRETVASRCIAINNRRFNSECQAHGNPLENLSEVNIDAIAHVIELKQERLSTLE